MKAADYINAIIALGTLLAAFFAWFAAKETRDIAGSSRVQQLQALYLTYYASTLDANKDAFDPNAYNQLPPNVQARAGITFGLLTSLIDAMYTANDPRLSITIKSLEAFGGPICAYRIERHYATDPRTLADVEQVRKNIRAAGGTCAV
jgi:hypothetical protein